jgi:uncharacterized membrane protein YkvA (DUF1232 family)
MNEQKIPTKKEIKETARKVRNEDVELLINRKTEINSKLDIIDKNVFPKLHNQVKLFSLMLEDHANRTYRNFDAETISSVVLALKYFLSPGDYIPDTSYPLGYFDDAEVAFQVMISSQNVIQDYIKWKELEVKDYF